MIFVVEDDGDIRNLVCYTLEREGYKVKAFAEPNELWREMKGQKPQLLLLDIMLPGEDGLSILTKIRERTEYEDLPVIMMTARNSEFDKVTGLDMGADDYISKPFGVTELVSRVRAVLRRYEKTSAHEEYRIGELYVNPAKHIIRVCGEEVELSFKEYSCLLVLLEAKGDVVARDELLDRVWGEFYGESRTLDVHIRKLRMKLGSAGELIKTIKNVGYRLVNEQYLC